MQNQPLRPTKPTSRRKSLGDSESFQRSTIASRRRSLPSKVENENNAFAANTSLVHDKRSLRGKSTRQTLQNEINELKKTIEQQTDKINRLLNLNQQLVTERVHTEQATSKLKQNNTKLLFEYEQLQKIENELETKIKDLATKNYILEQHNSQFINSFQSLHQSNTRFLEEHRALLRSIESQNEEMAALKTKIVWLKRSVKLLRDRQLKAFQNHTQRKKLFALFSGWSRVVKEKKSAQQPAHVESHSASSWFYSFMATVAITTLLLSVCPVFVSFWLPIENLMTRHWVLSLYVINVLICFSTLIYLVKTTLQKAKSLEPLAIQARPQSNLDFESLDEQHSLSSSLNKDMHACPAEIAENMFQDALSHQTMFDQNVERKRLLAKAKLRMRLLQQKNSQLHRLLAKPK